MQLSRRKAFLSSFLLVARAREWVQACRSSTFHFWANQLHCIVCTLFLKWLK
ncbi:hypothetical protein BVRB_6g145600 [Beta vulgaris subsp. vulgaris]|nr:hypothetical protein BVRB_6g145600 [Beta vulgaris subsp. vulgaris]